MVDDGQALAALTGRLVGRVGELAEELARLIRRGVEFYRSCRVVSDEELHESLRANLTWAFGALTGPAEERAEEAARTGRVRARAGVPLPALMEAYRIGARFVWRSIVTEAEASGLVSAVELVAIASDVWSVQERTTHAMSDAYRDEQTQQILLREQERSALVGMLLQGRVGETTALWEVADTLRLSLHGPYVVVAAELDRPGRHGLPNVEVALRVADVASAWHLTPDLQVGIVQPDAPEQHRRLLVTLRRLAQRRVGVSPEFTDLDQVTDALRLARIAMAGSVPERGLVTVFDDESLAVLAAAAPLVSSRVASRVLAGLDQIPATDRALLLDTLRAWLDNDGSVGATARALYCHYNTVRHRLQKLQRLTGRSLTVPREQAELCLALEIERRFPSPPIQPTRTDNPAGPSAAPGTT